VNPGASHEDYLRRIEPLRAELDAIAATITDYLGRSDAAAPMSPAASDSLLDREVGSLAKLWRPILNATLGGGLQLRAAIDHFGALCRLLELPDTVLFADRVLVRAGIEACARCQWLTDWQIDARTRAARSLTERLYDLHEVDQFVGEDGHRNRMLERERFLVACSEAGFKYQTPKKSPAHIVGGERPGPTAVIKALLDDEGIEMGAGVQRYLSWFVHATTSGLARAVVHEGVVDVGEGVAHAPMGSNPGEVNQWLGLSLSALVATSRNYFTYVGHLDDAWMKSTTNALRMARKMVTRSEPVLLLR
jgi:hypothetical protein